MNQLTIINHKGTLVADSRQVAEMVEKNHKDLMRDIRTYCEYLDSEDGAKLRSPNFFIESTYRSEQNKALPCYLLTRKGCDMVANKMTGEKGVLFSAAYIDRFYEMERALASPQDAKALAAQERSRAMLLNAQTRMFNTVMKVANDKKLSPIAAEVFGLTVLEHVTGKQVDYRPKLGGKLYQAGEIGAELGVSANRIGKEANVHGLKTNEYGEWMMDKSPYSGKQVSAFRYNDKGKEALRQIIRGG